MSWFISVKYTDFIFNATPKLFNSLHAGNLMMFWLLLHCLLLPPSCVVDLRELVALYLMPF